MPAFRYEALTAGGQKSSGVMDADTQREARRKLREQNLHVTKLVPASFVQRSEAGIAKFKGFSRRRAMTVEAITRQLALLLENEIKLTDALTITMGEVTDKKTLLVLRDIRDRVANGSSVADAMEPHEWLFGHMYVSMVRVGETAGTLPDVLRKLADFMREQLTRSSQLGVVMIYPAIMGIVMVGVVTFLMAKVLPTVKEVLKSFGTELPLPTRILMGVYDIFNNHLLLILAVVAAVIIAIVSFLRTDRGRRTKDELALRAPFLGDLIRKSQTAQFASTLQTLLGSGVKVADSMTVLLETSNNTQMKDTISDLQESIMRGSDVSTVLRRSKIIPNAVAHMVAVGEQSGELEQVLTRLSSNLNAEVELSMARLNAFLQPIIILVMAAVVGFIVIATMLPIMEMGAMK